MPKNSKRKKEKTADFSKAKLKLGKGKKLANNAIDTSFKARSIVIPQQTIGLEKDASKPTTRKNLTIDDLLVHLKHYNSNTRKDAIFGLRELLGGHPQLVESVLAPVIQATARLVGDEDAEVRKTLLDFLSWLLRTSQKKQVEPHVPLLILFVTSAQTHISPAIRVDAIRYLNLLLEITPDIVTSGWSEVDHTGGRILDGYLGLLNVSLAVGDDKGDAPVASTSSITLSLNSKLVVLSSFATFLRAAILPDIRDDKSIPTWYMASCFSSRAGYLAFRSLVQPRSVGNLDEKETQWSNDVEGGDLENFVGRFSVDMDAPRDSELALTELADVEQAISSLKKGPIDTPGSHSKYFRITRLAHALCPILVSIWLDVAPTVFDISASGIGTEAQLALSVTQIAGCIYGVVFRELKLSIGDRMTALTDLTALLTYMSTYLPYTPDTSDAQSEELFSKINIIVCELTSLAAMESQQEAKKSSANVHASLNAKQRKALSTQTERVWAYVVQALDGELRSTSHPLGYSLTASSYTTLLPTIWSLLKYQLKCENGTTSKRICTSAINHAIRTPSRSNVKRPATQFVGLLALLTSQSKSSLEFHLELTSDERELLKDWYLQLPKVLWEVGAGDPVMTEIILRVLLRIAQRNLTFFDTNVLMSVRSRLVPYFIIKHPQKGEVLGPFTKLQQWSHLRRLTLDVVFTLGQSASSFQDDELAIAVNKTIDGTTDSHYWTTMLDLIRMQNGKIGVNPQV